MPPFDSGLVAAPTLSMNAATDAPTARRHHTINVSSAPPSSRSRRTRRAGAPSFGLRFALHRELGRGGHACVYEVIERRTGRRMALKIIDEHETRAAEQLWGEVELTRRVAGPGVPTVLDHGWLPGPVPYVAMPVLTGGSLADWIATTVGLQDRLQAVPRLVAIARVLDRAHRRGVVHRDCKPANIMLDGSDAYLIDWGIASSMTSAAPTDPNVEPWTGIMGTPAYMPPEQARGGTANPRTDIYALGATLYTLLSGVKPYQATSWLNVLTHLLDQAPASLAEVAPEVPPPLVEVVERAMSRDPAARHPSAGAFACTLAVAWARVERSRRALR